MQKFATVRRRSAAYDEFNYSVHFDELFVPFHVTLIFFLRWNSATAATERLTHPVVDLIRTKMAKLVLNDFENNYPNLTAWSRSGKYIYILGVTSTSPGHSSVLFSSIRETQKYNMDVGFPFGRYLEAQDASAPPKGPV